MPEKNLYGNWPMSGEIDLVESRGNRKLFAGNINVGAELASSTLHFGPRSDYSGWRTAHYAKNESRGFDEDFHVYKFIWTEDAIRFIIDDEEFGVVNAGDGFWARGHFEDSGLPNPWINSTSPMAPFDQEFYLMINLAVGSTSFFSDGYRNEDYPKPWWNYSPTPLREFWDAKEYWLPTWNMNSEDSHLQVDYIRVWAL